MIPSRGEVWLVDLGTTVADEIRKVRPAVVVNADDIGVLALRVICPITRWQEGFEEAPWFAKIDPDRANGLDKPSAADTFQIRSISLQRFRRRIGRLAASALVEVERALQATLKLDS